MLRVRDGDKVLAARQVTLAADGQTQTENVLFNVGAAGAKSLAVFHRSAARRGRTRRTTP